jgi:hypothetical protein
MSLNLISQEDVPLSTFDTPEPITATIDLGVGDLRITASDRGTTVVDVRPSDPSNDEDRKAVELTRVEYTDGQLLVKASKRGQWRLRGGGPSIEVTIELPAGSNVHGSLAAADYQSDGRLGECRIKTGLGRIQLDEAGALNLKSGAGDISVERATGPAEVSVASGDVRIGSLGATAMIKNSNGDTWIGAAADDLRVKAANGSIAVDRAQGNVVAKSANGDVRLGDVVRGSVVLETAIGDLEVGIREGTAAWLDVNASAGKVHNTLEASGTPDASSETVEVRARTSVGTITIRRP